MLPSYKINTAEDLFKQLSTEHSPASSSFWAKLMHSKHEKPCKLGDVDPNLYSATSDSFPEKDWQWGKHNALYAAISAKRDDIAIKFLKKAEEKLSREEFLKYINAQDSKLGTTPLYTAIWRGSFAMAATLIKAKADITLKDHHELDLLDSVELRYKRDKYVLDAPDFKDFFIACHEQYGPLLTEKKGKYTFIAECYKKFAKELNENENKEIEMKPMSPSQ
jgi:hypothetical protein